MEENIAFDNDEVLAVSAVFDPCPNSRLHYALTALSLSIREQQILASDPSVRVRTAIAIRKGIDPTIRNELKNDPDENVAKAAQGQRYQGIDYGGIGTFPILIPIPE